MTKIKRMNDQQKQAFDDLRTLFREYATPKQQVAFVEMMGVSMIREAIDFMIIVVGSHAE